MVAINFKPEFAEQVESGQKTQTIRKVRKNPIKAGDKLTLYTGQRTNDCRKLGEVVCVEVIEIEINNKDIRFYYNNREQVSVFRKGIAGNLGMVDHFAIQDGFTGWGEMRHFFQEHYGLPFEGVVIRWEAPGGISTGHNRESL